MAISPDTAITRRAGLIAVAAAPPERIAVVASGTAVNNDAG